VWLHPCVAATNGSSRSECIKCNCDVMTVLFCQHNMDCIKTEHYPNAEVHLVYCSEIQLVDFKQEEQPVSIGFPRAEYGNDVSCQCVCC
jgi:hypothetical protein